MPEGRVSDAQFGTITGIPLPNDFDGDGSLDLAYWEPKDNKIFVSFDKGRTISRTIIVPPDSIPAFVNMY